MMRTSRFTTSLYGALVAATLSTAPAAATTIGGLDFADDAFANVLLDSFGDFTFVGAATLADAVTGSTPESYAFSFTPGAYLELAFTNVLVVNGAGADLALFELGVPDTLVVTINGVTLSALSVDTGVGVNTDGGVFDLNVAQFDLSDFGVPDGGTISSLRIGMDTPGDRTVPSLAVVGALSSVPVVAPEPVAPIPLPASLPLLLGGVLGLALLRRRRTS